MRATLVLLRRDEFGLWVREDPPIPFEDDEAGSAEEKAKARGKRGSQRRRPRALEGIAQS